MADSNTLACSGYQIYSNTGSGDAIDYSNAVANVGLSPTSWTSTTISAPGTWSFGVRAINTNGAEQNIDCAVTIVLDAFGNDITSRPGPPTGLRAFATSGGDIRVEWWYPPKGAIEAPTGFNCYKWIGEYPSYESPVATVPYTAGLFNSFVANLTGLSDGTAYWIGVRAYNGSGEESNTYAISVVADATGPGAVDSLIGTAIV